MNATSSHKAHIGIGILICTPLVSLRLPKEPKAIDTGKMSDVRTGGDVEQTSVCSTSIIVIRPCPTRIVFHKFLNCLMNSYRGFIFPYVLRGDPYIVPLLVISNLIPSRKSSDQVIDFSGSKVGSKRLKEWNGSRRLDL